MHAGIPAMGAVDALHEALTTLGEHKFRGKQFVGGVAGVAIFFDQIRRDLVFRICRAAGMPEGVVQVYEVYINNLKVYNCVAGGMGKPYVRLCGIPHGCSVLDDHGSTHYEAVDHSNENLFRHHLLHTSRRCGDPRCRDEEV